MLTEKIKEDQLYLIRLDLGDEIITSLQTIVRQNDWGSGWITGIGAVKNTTLGYFDLESREYKRRDFSEEMELISCQGNISWSDDEPVIHLHATLADANYSSFAGHLFSAEIAVTGEIYCRATKQRITRSLDKRTGLKLIQQVW